MFDKYKTNKGTTGVETLIVVLLVAILIALIVNICVLLIRKPKAVSAVEDQPKVVASVNKSAEIENSEQIEKSSDEDLQPTLKSQTEEDISEMPVSSPVNETPINKTPENKIKKENLPDIDLYCPKKLNEIAKMFDIIVYKNTVRFQGTYTNCLLSEDKTSLTVCGKSRGSNQDLCHNYTLKDNGWITSSCFFSSPETCSPTFKGEHYDCNIIDKKNYFCKFCQGRGPNVCSTPTYTSEVSNVAKNYFLEKICEKPNTADNTCSKYRSITLYKKRPDGTFKSVGCEGSAISGNTCHHYNMFCRENGSCFQPGQWQKYQGDYIKAFLQ